MPEFGVSRDFVGVNRSKPETNLTPNEAAEATNCVVSRERVEKRQGSLRISPWVIPQSSVYCHDSKTVRMTIATDTYAAYYAHSTDFTLEVACRVPSSSYDTNSHGIVGRGVLESHQVHGWNLEFDQESKVLKYEEMLTTGSFTVQGTYSAFAPNKPFMVSVVRNGGDAKIRVNDGSFSDDIKTVSGIGDFAETHTVSDLSFGYYLSDIGTNWTTDVEVQEFRVYPSTAKSDAKIDSEALKELHGHQPESDNCDLYLKFTDGSGSLVNDFGYSYWSSGVDRLSAVREPSKPGRVAGLVHGGLGDYAADMDGYDDLFFVVPIDDQYGAFRTGTSDWSAQWIFEPGENLKADSVVGMYGNSAFETGTTGHAFKVYVDYTGGNPTFTAAYSASTETTSINWTTAYTHSVRYGMTVQKVGTQFRFRVDDLTNEVDGTYLTADVSTADAPEFPAYLEPLWCADYAGPGAIPTDGYAQGKLDEVRLWDSAVYQPLNRHLSDLNDTRLIGYWKFNESDGIKVRDVSQFRNAGLLAPGDVGPEWWHGIVTPVEGPEVLGLFHYQSNLETENGGGVFDRKLIVCAGNTIYQSDGEELAPLISGRDNSALYSADQVDNQLILVNGKDDNLLFDGERIWDAGVKPPTEPPVPSVIDLTGQGPWDDMGSGDSSGISNLTAFDTSRTEPSGTFDGKRVFHDLGGTTATTRCEKYFNSENRNVSAAFNTSSLFVSLVGSFGDIPAGGLESVALSGLVIGGTTETNYIKFDPGSSPNARVVGLEAAFSNGQQGFQGGADKAPRLYFNGHFRWDTAASNTLYNTTTYDISIVDGGVTGPFFYRTTNYNRYTGEQSNPSPPSDDVVSPSDQGVAVTISTATYTNVTDRLLWRTKFQGGRDSANYFFIGTFTGTSFGTYLDVTPSGEEGELISFFRAVPPKAKIVKTFKGRMWYVPVGFHESIYFSEVYKPTEVDDFNFLVFGGSDDGINGLGVNFDSLVALKRQSIWLVTRSDIPTGMGPYLLLDGVGCVAPHSVREVDRDLYFLGQEGVYSLEGSTLRRVSEKKMQWWFKRMDHNIMDRAVAVNLQDQGIYRLNIPPASLYATNVQTGRNSWYLDYHYQKSRDHVPFFETIWTHGDREVSYYDAFIGEDNRRYVAYGDYRGFVYVDDIPEAYTDGLGWYREGAVSGANTTLFSTATSGGFTATISNQLYSRGDGLKGLKAVFFNADGDRDERVIAESTQVEDGTEMILQTALSAEYGEGTVCFIAPIISKYRTGWQDLGRTMRDKRWNGLKLDTNLETTASTMTVTLMGGREDDGLAKHYSTQAVTLSKIQEHRDLRVRGRHVMLQVDHEVPGGNFQLFNWDILTDPSARPKGDG